MVCPLRYVVAAVSLVVMLAALTWGSFGAGGEEERANSSRSGTKNTKKKWTQWVLDLFTGRYLYEMWTARGNRSNSVVVPVL